jgi:autotransporter-associated beta strand protein
LNGTTAAVTESIGVRGPGQGLTGYAYLGGSGTLPTALDSATRPTTTNTVQILLNATNQLTVTLQQGGSAPQTVLEMDLSGYTRPDLLSFGFTAGTGGATDFINVNNLLVSSLAATRWTNSGGSSLWSTNTNWNPTVVPSTGADILFDNSFVNSAQTIDTVANRNVRSITFDAPFNYALNNNTITFDKGAVAGFSGIAVTQTNGTGIDTINSNLSLNNAINIRNNAAGTLNLTGAIATNGNTVTIDGAGANTSLSGAISGNGAVVKNDSGTATLSGASNYSGGTTLNNGTLNANNGAALGTGGVTLAGGTLASTNSSTISNTVALTGNAGLSNLTTAGTLTQTNGNFTLNMANATQSGGVNLSNSNTGQTLTVQVDSGTSTIGGTIADGGTSAGGVSKTGSGTLVLSGTNSYSGATTINQGTVQLGVNNALATASTLNLAGGTLNLNGKSDKVGNLTFSLSSGGTIDYGTTNSNNTLVVGNIATAGSGSGMLTINNYAGGDYLGSTATSTTNAAALGYIYFSGYGAGATEAASLNSAGNSEGNAFQITPLAINWGPYTWTRNATTAQNWGTGGNWQGGNRPNGTTNVYVDFGTGTATTVNFDTNNTVNALRFDSGAAAYAITDAGTHTLTLSNPGSIPFIQQQSSNAETLSPHNLTLGGNTVVDVTGTGSLTIGSVVQGNYDIVKTGNGGKLILTGNNTFTGGLFINNGVVQAGNTGALGTGATTISDGTTLELSGGISPTNALSVSGQGVSGAGAIHNVNGTNTASGAITLAGDTRIAADTGTTLNLSGNLTGAGRNLEIAGAGTVSFGGATANTYTGTTTVSSGTLVLNKTASTNAVAGDLAINGGAVQLSASNQIADTAGVTLNGSGTFNLNGNAETIRQLNSTSSTTTVSLGAGALTVNGPANANSNFAGTISGTGSLTKSGAGTLTLSRANSYTGATNINEGTLAIGADNALSQGTAVTIASGATLTLNNYADQIGSLAGAGTVNLGNGNLGVGLNGTSTIFSGAFTKGDTGTLYKGGSGTLTLGAGMDLSAGNLVLVGGTLNLGGFKSTFKNLTVAADSTIDFGTGVGSILDILNTVTVNAGVTLSIINWTNAVDYFYAAKNPFSAPTTILGQIVFKPTYAGSDTKWVSFDHEITPVPEPSTYGAAFMLLGLSAGIWWRFRRRNEANAF